MHLIPEIESAIRYAEARAFRFKPSPKGHSYGTLLCPLADRSGCRIRVASTPRNAVNEMTASFEPSKDAHTGSSSMTEHRFTLVFTGDFSEEEPFDSMSDAVYEFVDDGTVVCRAGRASMMFDRPAETIEEAVVSAIRDVAKAGFKVDAIHTDESDTIAGLNDRLSAGSFVPELTTA